MKAMQSKSVPGLFFAGEILDIDGITGGYNFQSVSARRIFTCSTALILVLFTCSTALNFLLLAGTQHILDSPRTAPSAVFLGC